MEEGWDPGRELEEADWVQCLGRAAELSALDKGKLGGGGERRGESQSVGTLRCQIKVY